ncbi:hypothetical protein [Bdellovibrio sp. HCB274]|uniref:hypothetical protein n=1 Tax=Bdellovibrio sp. HCB274 TaxID=3394361 RepID=UPI0039B395BD
MKSLVLLFLIISQTTFAAESSLTEKISGYLPNAVSMDLAMNETSVFLVDRDTIKSPNSSVSNSEGIGSLANAISLSMAPSKNRDKGFGTKISPEVTFAFNNLRFNSAAVLLDSTDFQILRTSLGVSAELNYKMDIGTIYTSIGLGGSYSWISWSSPASGGAISGVNKNFTLGAGYYTYLTETLLVKLFARFISEDDNVWNKALDTSQGFDVPVQAVVNTLAGVSLAYTFQ